MRTLVQVFGVVAGLGLAVSVVAAAESKTPAPKSAARTKVSYGKPFTATPAVAVGDVLKASDHYEGKQVKLTGVVTQVCQAKGCWFEVAPTDKARGVRIKSADYSIFVPKDSAGRTATVEGTFVSKTLSEGEAKHLADDAKQAGQPAPDVKPAQKEFQLAAVAVELN